MQSCSRCPKESKIYLLDQMLIQLCRVAVKGSLEIASTRRKTVNRASYSDRELLLRN